MLVAPDDLDRLLGILADRGWMTDGLPTSPRLYPTHSVTMRHGLWPVEIDVHRLFPGFLQDADHVFDVLWERREEVPWCNQMVATPDASAHLLIMALHGLRHPDASGGSEPALALADSMRAAGLGAGVIAEAGELARQVGALRTAAPLLQLLGVPGPFVCSEAPDLALGWDRRRASEEASSTPWLLAMAQAGLRERLSLVIRAIWPDTAELRRHYGSSAQQPVGRARVRCLRILRAARGFPRAWREFRSFRGERR